MGLRGDEWVVDVAVPRSRGRSGAPVRAFRYSVAAADLIAEAKVETSV